MFLLLVVSSPPEPLPDAFHRPVPLFVRMHVAETGSTLALNRYQVMGSEPTFSATAAAPSLGRSASSTLAVMAAASAATAS